MPASKQLLSVLFHRRYPVASRRLILQTMLEAYELAHQQNKPYQPLLKNKYLLYRLRGSGLVLLKTQMSKKPKNPV